MTKGFTLLEMLVVVMIVGILAAVSIPRYLKTVETARARDAQALVQLIAQANRMWRIDNNNQWVNDAQCRNNFTNNCDLVQGNYLARKDWANFPYRYWACNGPGGPCGACAGACGGANAIARADRRAGTYTAWGYRVTRDGCICAVTATTPAPPN